MGGDALMKWEVTAPIKNMQTGETGRLVVARCMKKQYAENIVNYSISYEGLKIREIK